MTLTKKKSVIITIALAIVFFVPLLFLPESIIGQRDENLLLFIPKLMFLAITAAIVIVVILVFIFRSAYITALLYSFNRFKYYLRLLVKRDFISKYRKSILGVIWSLLNPLLTMLVLTLVFSFLFDTVMHFPVYVLSGQLVYNFFNESTTLAMNSVIANEGIIKKIYVPKYIFPLARVMSSLVNLFFSFIAFMLVFIFTRVPFQWTMLLLPVPILYLFVFALGVAMFVSSLAVFFRDLTYLYGVSMMLLFFLTPIMYPVDIIPDWLMPYYGLNPLFHFVTYYRNLALWGTIPDLWANMVCIGYALSALCVGTYTFMKQQDKLILSN